MNLAETRQAARHARAAEAETRDARVEPARAAHRLAMTVEICQRFERIEAAIRVGARERVDECPIGSQR